MSSKAPFTPPNQGTNKSREARGQGLGPVRNLANAFESLGISFVTPYKPILVGADCLHAPIKPGGMRTPLPNSSPQAIPHGRPTKRSRSE